jgi:short subunit dehydrogenase-like uncharacterized protein
VLSPVAALWLQAAITLLLDQAQLPAGGGVFTGGFLLRDTRYVERLVARGVKIETVSDTHPGSQ